MTPKIRVDVGTSIKPRDIDKHFTDKTCSKGCDMVFPYLRNYQQSTGWPTINDTTCPKGEWKYVDRWGKKPKYNWVRSLTIKIFLINE